MNWLQKIANNIQIIPGECTGSHSGQRDCVIKAQSGDRLVGYLSYAEFQGETFIQHVEVAEDMRRLGIATMLYDALKQEADGGIRHTNSTPDGTSWRNSLTASHKET